MADESAKWETVRRLRYGALVKLFRHRWGHVLPDDDAGRGDLWLLLQNVSLAPVGADEKMHHVIEVWAPWLSEDEANERIEFIKLLTIPERTPTARDIGERLRLTNAERQGLKLWPFKPIDASDDDIAAQRRARRNERRRMKRGRTRAEYLAACLSQQRPWEVEGIHRATWYRRRAKFNATPRGHNNTSKAESIPVASEVVESQRGLQGGAEVVRLSERTKAKGAERTASGSSRLCHNLSQLEREQKAVVFAKLARDFSSSDPRMSWAMLAYFVASFEPRAAERGAA